MFPTPRSCNRCGFTLPLVLVVMCFAIIVVVAFAATLRVESQVSLNYKRQYEARQNALFGLRLALGRLQEAAGRDQSITARSDILGSTSSPNPYWTGVWDVRADDPYTPTSPLRTNGVVDSSKQPPEWLVSSTGTADPTKAAADLSPLGAITLVGTNSASSTVQAGLVETPKAGRLGGRYAYWVGDEGVKARINLADPGSSAARSPRHSFMTAQRFGIEAIDGLEDFQQDHAKLGQVIRNTQLSHLGLDAAAVRARYFDLTPHSSGILSSTRTGGLRKDLTWAFELDDTAFGALLSNSSTDPESLPSFYLSQGNPDFADGSSAHRVTPFNAAYRSLLATGEVSAETAYPWERGPTWELLRSFFRLKYKITSDPLPLQKKTAIQQGVYPIITRVIFNIHPGLGPRVAPGTRKARVYLDPQVVLWNPYNVATAPGSYYFEMVLHQRSGGVTFQYREGEGGWNPSLSEQDTVSPNIVIENNFPSRYIKPEGWMPNDRFGAYLFRIVDPGLAPGESRVFSIPGTASGTPYVAGMDLTNGDVVDRGLVHFEKATINVPDAASSRLIRGLTGGGYDSFYSLGLRDVAGAPTVAGSYNRFDDYFYRIKFTETGFVANAGARATNVVTLGTHIPEDIGGYYPGEKLTFQYLTADGSTHRVSNASDWNPFGKWLVFHDPRAPFQANDPNASGIRQHGYHETVHYGNQWASFGGAPQIDTDPTGKKTFHGSGRTLGNGSPVVALFDIPRVPTGIISLGALQHAQVASLSYAGAYVIGASLASPILESPARLIREPLSSSKSPAFVDLSYFLNESLFDNYFFSTIPASLTEENLADSSFTLPNSRLKFHQAGGASDLLSLHSAAYLTIEGAFNINSTSVEAWSALLSSLNRLAFSPALISETDPLESPFSRMAYPLAGSDSSGSNPHPADWAGYRQLSPVQIKALAQAIVAQVKARGPFVSLAHFVNRQLIDSEAGKRGLLEQALADAGTNAAVQARSPLAQNPIPAANYNAALYSGPAFQAAPGWLTQGDLLQALAPVLSARSDTFVIRAYGDVVADPPGSKPIARAYCEAVVQRTAEFVDPANSKETPVSFHASREEVDLQPNPALTAINRELGRKFRIVSFRWIDENDL